METIEYKGSDDWVIAVERVATARVVGVGAVRIKHVVGPVVDASKGDHRPALIPLGGVVEDHVQNHGNPGDMERLHQVLELRNLVRVMTGGGIAALGGVETDRAVAPVVAELVPSLRIDPFVLVFVEFEDRHQLDAIHPDRLKIGDLLNDALIGAGVTDSRGRVPSESSYMHLVDDEILHGQLDRPIVTPVEILIRHSGTVRIDLVLRRPGQPGIAAAYLMGNRIEEDFCRIKAITHLGIVRPFHPEPIFQEFVVEIVNDHRPDIPDLALVREGNLGIGLRLTLSEEHQRAPSGMAGVNREVDTSRHMTRPVGKRVTVAHPEALILVGMMKGGADHLKILHQ